MLKEIDHDQECRKMGISIIGDTYTNKGYGTCAEKLLLDYALDVKDMEAGYSDARIMKNAANKSWRRLDL